MLCYYCYKKGIIEPEDYILTKATPPNHIISKRLSGIKTHLVKVKEVLLMLIG
jgi:hypothetical protein